MQVPSSCTCDNIISVFVFKLLKVGSCNAEADQFMLSFK